MAMVLSYIRWFETIQLEDVPMAGGKDEGETLMPIMNGDEQNDFVRDPCVT